MRFTTFGATAVALIALANMTGEAVAHGGTKKRVRTVRIPYTAGASFSVDIAGNTAYQSGCDGPHPDLSTCRVIALKPDERYISLSGTDETGNPTPFWFSVTAKAGGGYFRSCGLAKQHLRTPATELYVAVAPVLDKACVVHATGTLVVTISNRP